MTAQWYPLVMDLLDFAAGHALLSGVAVTLGPELEVPEATAVRLTRGPQVGDQTAVQREQRLTVYAECYQVSDDDYRTRNQQLADLEDALMQVVREWRQTRERVTGIRHQARVENTKPDGGVFLPHALASRTEITITWQETPR